jgi:hypothetical protein
VVGRRVEGGGVALRNARAVIPLRRGGATPRRCQSARPPNACEVSQTVGRAGPCGGGARRMRRGRGWGRPEQMGRCDADHRTGHARGAGASEHALIEHARCENGSKGPPARPPRAGARRTRPTRSAHPRPPPPPPPPPPPRAARAAPPRARAAPAAPLGPHRSRCTRHTPREPDCQPCARARGGGAGVFSTAPM